MGHRWVAVGKHRPCGFWLGDVPCGLREGHVGPHMSRAEWDELRGREPVLPPRLPAEGAL